MDVKFFKYIKTEREIKKKNKIFDIYRDSPCYPLNILIFSSNLKYLKEVSLIFVCLLMVKTERYEETDTTKIDSDIYSFKQLYSPVLKSHRKMQTKNDKE